MRAKIDKEGKLWIERAGVFKSQDCLFSCGMDHGHSGPTMPCCDSCPAFGEPFKVSINELNNTEIKLVLCQQVGDWYFDKFVDERNQDG